MQMFPPGPSRRREGGFTLVEVMATLAVIGLVASAVVLAAPGEDARLRTGAERLGARLKLASDQSILINREIALVGGAEGYHFERREDGGWRRIDAPEALGFEPWPGKTPPSFEVPIEPGEEGDSQRLATFDPLGGATGMRLEFGAGVPSWSVSIDETGAIHVDRAR